MDRYRTAQGDVDLSRLGHASLMFLWQGLVIHVDPYSAVYDYARLPHADLLLITHHHSDHFDLRAIAQVCKSDTTVVSSQLVADKLRGALAMSNGEKVQWGGVRITALPAYNRLHMRHPNEPYHIPGEGNGYLLELAGLRIYIAGDTELIPEMDHLGRIDIAFLPKNLPYTMSDEMFVAAARRIRPRFLYPYHYFDLDTHMLQGALPRQVAMR